MSDANRQKFLDTVRSQLDYRALPGRSSIFGQTVGYPNQPWNGSFLEWAAGEAGIDMPPFTSTVTALSHFVRQNRVYRKPRVGDIAFFETAEPFGQPRVGVVTVTDRWKRDNSFRTIEAEVGSPHPRGNTDPTGVFEITHYGTDLIGFARPTFQTVTAPHPADTGVVIRPSSLRSGNTTVEVRKVQEALYRTVGARDMQAGRFDKQTVSAYARWQRICGLVGKDADGTPDFTTLMRLAERDGTFTVKE